ncbi:MAG: Rap1a/Tai family immunity protein [Hyphomicrobiales bacterium]
MFRLKTWLAVAATAIALGQVGSAAAGFVSGTELRDSCRPQKIDPVYRLKVAECRGYVLGIADSFDCARPLRQPAWNSQSAASQEELVNTVLVWLDSHPQSLTFQADGLVAAALAEGFPCP